MKVFVLVLALGFVAMNVKANSEHQKDVKLPNSLDKEDAPEGVQMKSPENILPEPCCGGCKTKSRQGYCATECEKGYDRKDKKACRNKGKMRHHGEADCFCCLPAKKKGSHECKGYDCD